MPTYSTLETIKEVMVTQNLIRWKVVSESDDMLHKLEPPTTCTPQDSFNTLQIFLNQLTGTGYVLITLYDRAYKPNGGGALGQWVYKHYYKVSPGGSTEVHNPGNGGMSGYGADYIALHTQILELKKQMEMKDLTSKIETLEKELKAAEKNNKSGYFERVAETIGKSWAKEYLKTEGYSIAEDGTVTTNDERPVTKKTEPAASTTKTETPDKAREQGKQASAAILRISKAVGDTDTVITGLSEIADMAEKNPLKLVEILGQIKEANEANGS